MESYVERERQLKGCILNHAEQFRTKWTPNQTTTERLKYETFNQIHIHHKQRQREINSRWYNLYSVFFLWTAFHNRIWLPMNYKTEQKASVIYTVVHIAFTPVQPQNHYCNCPIVDSTSNASCAVWATVFPCLICVVIYLNGAKQQQLHINSLNEV